MCRCGLVMVRYERLSGGIAAIHAGVEAAVSEMFWPNEVSFFGNGL